MNNSRVCIDNDRIYIFRPGIEKINPVVPLYNDIIVVKKRAPCHSFTNLFWHIFSGFSYYRYSLVDLKTDKEIAYSHISTGLPHLDFVYRLGGGVHIGPDYTVPEYRGKLLHPYLLTKILEDIVPHNLPIYMCVAENNRASWSGIERVGFVYCGRSKHEDLQYKLVNGSSIVSVVKDSNTIWNWLFSFVSRRILRKH